MKRLVAVWTLLAATILLTNVSMYAQRGRGGGAGGGVGGGSATRGPSSSQGQSRGNSANAGPSSNASGKSGGKPDDPKAASKDKKPDNKVADELHLNPKLETQVKGMLPPNTTIEDAAAGFKNRGQFIAALHVSKNLNIPFTDLKAKMTGEHPSSLGDSIATLRPDLGKAKANEEAKRGEKAAKDTEKAAKA
jgi:hypothetical protein